MLLLFQSFKRFPVPRIKPSNRRIKHIPNSLIPVSLGTGFTTDQETTQLCTILQTKTPVRLVFNSVGYLRAASLAPGPHSEGAGRSDDGDPPPPGRHRPVTRRPQAARGAPGPELSDAQGRVTAGRHLPRTAGRRRTASRDRPSVRQLPVSLTGGGGAHRVGVRGSGTEARGSLKWASERCLQVWFSNSREGERPVSI